MRVGLIEPQFLRLLQRLGQGPCGRDLVEEVLDGLIAGAGAERGFIYRIRSGGGFRVLLARNSDREPVPEPERRMSHYAVRRALEEADPHRPEHVGRDRRYRTEESLRTGRAPVSILILPLRPGKEVRGGVYLDHRFHALPPPAALAAEPWRALLEVALQVRERERALRRARRAGEAAAGPLAPRHRVPLLPSAPPRVEVLHGLLASSPDMLDLFDAARRLGPSDLPVVLRGETGTGKELLARAIHLESPRKARQFLAVTCGGIPDPLLESELFGHARGAFTGAESERQGLLLQADGGTVLLDEVGDMSPQMQRKLLHFLEDGRVRPLGHRSPVRIQVRIISSTNRDLDRLVEDGSFRKDLYYRLRGTVLSIPPLRERREEIAVLAEHFLERLAGAAGREPPRLSGGARRRLLAYGWPGNVRELENEMRRLVGLGHRAVEERHLSPFLKGGAGGWADRAPLRMERVVFEAEREAIQKALARSAGNKSRAAALLGITRKALYRRLARYGIR